MIHCKFENDDEVSLRHVTIGAVVEKDGKILLVKRSADSYLEPNKWTIPGGFLERDESTEGGTIREAMEETGGEIEITELIRINSAPERPKEDRQNVDVIYAAKGVKQTGEHDNEVSEVKWFKKDQLPAEEEFAFDHYDNVQLYLKAN